MTSLEGGPYVVPAHDNSYLTPLICLCDPQLR
jgi:hypothetical protein